MDQKSHLRSRSARGGTRNSLLEVRVEDVIRLNDTVVFDITKKE